MGDVFDGDRGADLSVLRSLGVVSLPAVDRVTAAGVVPIDAATGKMIAVTVNRGIDFPGGHRHERDASVEAVARRECMEEAGAELGQLEVIDVVESTFFGTTPEAITYVVVFAGAVEAMDEFRLSHEVHAREWLFPSAFLSRYDSGDPTLIERWLRLSFEAISVPWR